MASSGTPGTADFLVYGGTGTLTSEDPVTCDFANALTYGTTRPLPLGPVPARPMTGKYGTQTGYQTSPEEGKRLDWPFPLFGSCSSATLDLRDVSIRFSATAHGLIRSDMQGEMYGFLSGCFTRESADAVYLDSLAMSFGQLLDGSGAEPDCDPDGGNNLVGYTLEFAWEATELVALNWQG